MNMHFHNNNKYYSKLKIPEKNNVYNSYRTNKKPINVNINTTNGGDDGGINSASNGKSKYNIYQQQQKNSANNNTNNNNNNKSVDYSNILQ